MTILILGNNNPGNNNNNNPGNNNNQGDNNNPGNNNNPGDNNNNNKPGNNNNNGDTEVKPDPNRPTINLNVGGRYTINPYEYVNKEYSNKKLDFNIKNTSVATMSKNKDSNNNDVITFTGTGNGLTTATISSGGTKLYEMDIYVNSKNTTPSTNNLNPVKDNAASQKPDNNNNNNNNGNNNVDNEATPDMPTIKLNIGGSYTINPYKYVHKDYKFKHLTFKYNNSAVADLEINKQTRLAKITGKAEGNTILSITSEGKDLYKINIDVKKDNQISATNLNPVRDNADESNDNNNNNNPGNNNNNNQNNNNNPGNNNNNNQNNNNNNQGNNNNNNNNNNQSNNNNNQGNNNNNNNSGNITSDDNEQDPLVKAGYYTPKGETPKTPETPKEVDLSKNPTPKTPETPKNVDLSKNPNTPNKPGNITRKPNTIPRSGIDYAIYFALAGAIILGGITLFKYIKLNKEISNKKK